MDRQIEKKGTCAVRHTAEQRNGVCMKLLVGKVLMETDHIEAVEQLSPHTVWVYFVSGLKAWLIELSQDS